MYEINELIPMFQKWGVEKGLNNLQAQTLKLLEEIDEHETALTTEKKYDAIGDCLVVIFQMFRIMKRNIWHNVDGAKKRTYTCGFNLGKEYDGYGGNRPTALSIAGHALRNNHDGVVNCISIIIEDISVEIDPILLKWILNDVWDNISKRTGKTIDGSFIKSEDLCQPNG